MTHSTPTGWADRCMIEDPSAEHQIRIMIPSRSNRLYVSCTCMPTGSRGPVGANYAPLREITDAAEALWVHREHVQLVHQETTGSVVPGLAVTS